MVDNDRPGFIHIASGIWFSLSSMQCQFKFVAGQCLLKVKEQPETSASFSSFYRNVHFT